MKDIYQVIKKVRISEKATMLQETTGELVFEVDRDANKIEIKKAVEELFGVKVAKVNTISMKSKSKRVGYHIGETSEWKKAIVTLKEDSKTIEFFDSMM